MLKEKLWPEIIRNQTVKPNKLTNEKGCSTYTTQRYVDLEMPKHLGKSCRVCIFQPLVKAVFSRTNEHFFPVQQQSQFPKDKIKRQQEVKSDQTWLLPCILPGVCLKCIQTWCGSGYIHIKDTRWDRANHGLDRSPCLWPTEPVREPLKSHGYIC